MSTHNGTSVRGVRDILGTRPIIAVRRRSQKARITRGFPEPTPGLEPGTPSLRETPEALAGDHERRLAVTNDLQMRLFVEGSEEQT